MSELNESSSRKNHPVPRGKSHRETHDKTTVGLYLSKSLVEKARKHGLNLSRITEQALNSILDYLETQNKNESSKEGMCRNREVFAVDGAGFEPAASTMPTWRSFQTDLPAQPHSN